MAEAKKSAATAVKTAVKKAPAKVAVKAPAKTAAKKSVQSTETQAADMQPVDVAASAAKSKKTPSHHEIAVAAYGYWSERGHHHGSDQQDWLRAEKELSGK